MKFGENFSKGDKHQFWKGDKVGYSGIHKWVRINFGRKPKNCSECGIEGKQNGRMWSIEYANISGEYKRDKEDWVAVCRKCHYSFYDKKSSKTIWIDNQLIFKHEVNK